MNPQTLNLAAATAVVQLVADVVRALVPALDAVRRVAESTILFRGGFNAGYELRPRDWDAPDHWHRGYLRGRLEGLRARRTALPAEPPRPRKPKER